jgi:hypothetical protein
MTGRSAVDGAMEVPCLSLHPPIVFFRINYYQYLRQKGKVVRCRVELRCARRQLTNHNNGAHLWSIL